MSVAGGSGTPSRPRASVVVPAHQEEAVIARCLAALLAGSAEGEVEVVVVPNGCTDRTAALARAVPGVRVVELEQGSKAAALAAGDAAALAFPRIYLDADVVLDGAALRALVDVLDVDAPVVAAPRARFATAGRPWVVRAFYRTYERLPYVADGLVGLGVYGLSASGRARFETFPAITSDDLFVQRLFRREERVVLEGHAFDVEVPRTLRSLLDVRVRTAQGNSELAEHGAGDEAFATSTRSTLTALARVVLREPRLLPSAAAYVAVVVAARHRARRQPAQWYRDVTTR